MLTLKNRQKVTTAEMWWKERRPEILEDFEREVIGRVPRNIPKVTWTVVSNITDGLVGKLPANGKRLVGHVDNSAFPEITVDIRMTVVTPPQAKGPVPVLMMFGGFSGTDFRARRARQNRPIGLRILAALSRILHRPSNCWRTAGVTR